MQRVLNSRNPCEIPQHTSSQSWCLVILLKDFDSLSLYNGTVLVKALNAKKIVRTCDILEYRLFLFEVTLF